MVINRDRFTILGTFTLPAIKIYCIIVGVDHISRRQVINNHTRLFATRLFDLNEDKCAVIFDATYIYGEKSENYDLQRNMHSMHKKRSLTKPMMCITTTGYIIDAFGLYFANGENNDASILRHLLVSYCTNLFASSMFFRIHF